MKAFGFFALKCAAVWVALMVGQALSGMVMLLFTPPPTMASDGPLTVEQAVPVVALLNALVLSLVAARLRGPVIQRLATLFLVYWGVTSGLSLIEAWYFNAYLKLDPSLLTGLTWGDMVRGAVGAGTTFVLWRKAVETTDSLKGLVWKVPALTGLYIFAYFAAGALIAWQSPTLRAYYEQGAHIDNVELAGLQVLRGAIWVGLAALLARGLSGSALSRGVVTGLAFAVFMASALLTPTSFMPWEVRQFHMMEIGVSNFLFGMVAGLVLLSGRRRPA